MARAKNQKNIVRKRSYPAARLARQHPVAPEPNRLLKVWRRVFERRLRTRLRAKVAVEIHDNTHTMITFQRHRALYRVRLHHMFMAAPDEVLQALADFVRHGDAEASALLDKFIERNKAYIRRMSPEQMRKRIRLEPTGQHHDLARIFDRLNERYFRSRITAAITYGPAPRVKGPRKSIKMGSYAADSKVIRIHPALDQPVVPRYFVEWIVFHEMLHHVYRTRRGEDGRRCVHPPEFIEHERRFHDFKRAQAWEDENLDLLLRARVGD
jgi:AraC-like DNA-binding protein